MKTGRKAFVYRLLYCSRADRQKLYVSKINLLRTYRCTLREKPTNLKQFHGSQKLRSVLYEVSQTLFDSPSKKIDREKTSDGMKSSEKGGNWLQD